MPLEIVEELDYIFYDNKELADDHKEVAEFIHLLHEGYKLQDKQQKENVKHNEKVQKLIETMNKKNNKK